MNLMRGRVRKQNRRFMIIALSMIIALCLQTGLVCPVRAAAANTLNPSVDTVLKNVGNYILSVDKNPDYSSTWNVLGMVRSGQKVPTTYTNAYYNNTVNELRENNWQLSRTKYSDYSKLILGMTAIGKDARDIDGHNLLTYLSDFKKVKIQGFNGPIWALIALNSNPEYEIPLDLGASEQTTEEGLILYLLKGETSKGGWTLYGDTPDTDITGMTIQALSPYYGKREDVTAAVDRALAWMSSAQNSEGGYSTLNGSSTAETSESDAQVIVALCSIGIDPAKDSRFIRENGKWVMSRLFEYYISAGTDKGGFMHIFSGANDNGGGAAGTLNGMATEQGMYAVAAYKRLLTGKTALYDMSDVDLSAGGAPAAPSTGTSGKKTTTTASGTTKTSKKVKVTKLVLNYKKITMKKGRTRALKLKIYPANASNKKVTWTSSDKKVATVTKKGKVRALKAGRTTITVKAKDGSRKKAVCKVIVKKPSSSKNSSSSKVKVTAVNLNYSQLSIAAGSSRDLSATVTPSNASNKSLSWWSSDRSIATVSQSGQVKGIKAGTTTIHVRAKDGSGQTSSCRVIVYGSANTTPRPAPSDASNPAATTSTAATTGTQPEITTAKAAETTTEASAWSFEGDNYIPENGDEEEMAEEDEQEEDGKKEESPDEGSYDEQHEEDIPPWKAVLIGFAMIGATFGMFRIPWSKVKARCLILLALIKRNK